MIKLKFIFVFIILNSFFIQSQTKDLLKIKEIDSLLLASKTNDYSITSYTYYQNTLKKSISINYKKGELKSYLNLMLYFGSLKKLDSTIYYAQKFENNEYQDQDIKLKYTFFYNKAAVLLTYFDMVEQSMEEYNKAYKYLDSSDIDSKAQIKTDLAYNYITKKLYDKAIESLIPFTKSAIGVQPRNKYRLYAHLALAYQCKEDAEKSYPINIKALEVAKNLNDSQAIIFIKNNMLNDYYLKGEFQKTIDSGLAIREKIKLVRPDIKDANSYHLSLAHDTLGNLNRAIYYMKDAIHPNTESYNQIEVLEKIANLYEKKGDLKKSITSLKERNKIIDSARIKEQKTFIDYYDTKAKIIDQQREKEKIEAEKKILFLNNNKQKQYIVILMIGLICIVLAIISMFIYFKSKEKIKELKNNERGILKNHIEVRETELSILASSKAKLLSELSEIKKELSIAIRKNNKAEVSEVEKSLESFLYQIANDNVFSERLESQYPGMTMTLKQKHPELSQNDIRHCILIKLGLSLKESAQLMHVGTGAIKMGRNRAKAKMNLSEEVSLKHYLHEVMMELL